jgi:hypothetical protein
LKWLLSILCLKKISTSSQNSTSLIPLEFIPAYCTDLILSLNKSVS